jgi:hypothetical protein
VPRPCLSWLIAPNSCISADPVQSLIILQGPQATEVKTIGRTLDRWFSDDSRLFRFGLLMFMFRQGSSILFSRSVSIALYLSGLLIEQAAHSARNFQHRIGTSSLGKSVFHILDKELA